MSALRSHGHRSTSRRVARAPRDGSVPTPFLKWAGGKASVATEIESYLPADWRDRTYREPFLGGGAMFFHLRPARAVLSDTLHDLIATYEIVRDQVDDLIPKLEKLRSKHDEKQFYAVREQFNAKKNAPAVDRAAWLIYLNKTCFNGLYRTNRSGGFNVPFGRFKNPSVVHPERMRAASQALQGADLRQAGFEALLDDAEKGDVIYLDPPYDPVSRTANFASYAHGGFTTDDQRSLADVFRKLDRRGCLLALSNNNTDLVRELYEGFDFEPIEVARLIGAKSSTRGTIREVLIRNVRRYPGARTKNR